MGIGTGNIEGRLDITLKLSDSVVTGVDIQSSRPLQTPRIFVGKTVENLLSILPLLYSICGTAQAQAAVIACEQAMGLPEDAARQLTREKLVWLETAKEHLWRVLLDWPGFLGSPPASTGVGEIMQLIKRFRLACYPNERPFTPGTVPTADHSVATEALINELEQLLQEQVFGMPSDQWLELDGCDGLLEWASRGDLPAASMLQYVHAKEWSTLGRGCITALPALGGIFLQQQLDQSESDRFISAPLFNGHCHETSPYTRVANNALVAAVVTEYGSGLLARFTARLVELAGIPERLRIGVKTTANSTEEKNLPEATGIAQVEAARGRLIHRVVLDNEMIARYQILAPTEWNFHPAGVLAEGLKGLASDSAEVIKQQAALLINAIDPCVGYELQIEQD